MEEEPEEESVEVEEENPENQLMDPEHKAALHIVSRNLMIALVVPLVVFIFTLWKMHDDLGVPMAVFLTGMIAGSSASNGG